MGLISELQAAVLVEAREGAAVMMREEGGVEVGVAASNAVWWRGKRERGRERERERGREREAQRSLGALHLWCVCCLYKEAAGADSLLSLHVVLYG